MTSALALLPPAVAAALLLGGLRPTLAALIAYAVGLGTVLVFPTSLATLLQAEQRAVVTAAEVCAIILGGITLDELARRAGTMAAVGSWLRTVTRDVPHAVLLITLGLTPFFESITGFGIGAVIALSLLAAIGVAGPKRAILALLGLVAVPWGALAPGTLVAARLAGVSYRWLGTLSGMLSLPVFLVAGAAALIITAGFMLPWRAGRCCYAGPSVCGSGSPLSILYSAHRLLACSAASSASSCWLCHSHARPAL